jgi:protein TonB
MTFADRSQHPDRVFGVLCSLAVHAALGLALIAWPSGNPSGVRSRSAQGESVIVVELIPLDGADAGLTADTSGSGSAPVEKSERVPLSQGRGRNDPPQDKQTPAASALGAQDHGITANSTEQQSGGTISTRSGADSQAFRAVLLRHIERFRRYPDAAREANIEGTAQVRFAMNAEGQVLDVWIEMSSGYRHLDDEAMAAVLRARPLPALPAGWPSPMTVSLPIDYRLK